MGLTRFSGLETLAGPGQAEALEAAGELRKRVINEPPRRVALLRERDLVRVGRGQLVARAATEVRPRPPRPW